jgi:hypothetical protein
MVREAIALNGFGLVMLAIHTFARPTCWCYCDNEVKSTKERHGGVVPIFGRFRVRISARKPVNLTQIFLWFLSVHPWKCWDSTLKYVTNASNILSKS